jgi:CheY-like chemotaxis protein
MLPGGGGVIRSRRFPRVEAAFPVRVREASGPSSVGKATDLSPFGVKVRGASIAPPTIVRLEFSLSPTDPAFSILAVAVRSNAEGTAFAFVDLAKPDFLRLRQQVETLFLLRQLYIMVVEDDRDVADTLADYAEELGYAAVIMPNAEEALAYLAQDQPDAILLNLSLPGMSGLQFLQRLTQQGLRLPVVAISAASEPEAISSLKAGVLHFLLKPPDMEQLRLTLEMLELTSTKARLDTIERAFRLAF